MRSDIILGLAAAALAVPTTLSYMADAAVFTSYTDIPLMFPGFTEEQVNVVTMRRPKASTQGLPGTTGTPGETEYDTLTFVKRNNRWVVFGGDMNGAPIVEQMLDERVFQHMKRVRVDPEAIIFPDADPDILRENHLTAATAFDISCQVQLPTNVQGQSNVEILAELLIGKEARDGSYAQGTVPGFLVKKSDNNDIVLYDVPFWERPMEVNAWIDQNVHKFAGDTTVSFSLKNALGEAVFERRPGSQFTWDAVVKPANVGAVRQGEVATMITRYSQILGVTLIGPTAGQDLVARGLQPPLAEVSATLEDGSVHSIKIGMKVEGKNEYYALSGGLDFLRTIPAWAVDNFLKDPRELFDPPRP